MVVENQHTLYIRNVFLKMENKEDLLALLNYARGIVVRNNVRVFTVKQLNYYANTNDSKITRYVKFTIKKKSGSLREISAPNDQLKLIQICLNIVLQSVFNPHKSATGFVLNKSIVDNARIHTGNNYVYNIDLKDFFPSIDQARVWACLRNPPFNLKDGKQEIANLIAGLCCTKLLVERKEESGDFIKIEKSVLPQGAPTSPTLSNIVCQRLDLLLSGVAKRFNLRYSRYADDITFSSMHNVYQHDSDFVKEVNRIIIEQNFVVNSNKIRLQEQNTHRQEVTGLVVNDKVNIKRKYVKQIRSWLYLWEIYGYDKSSLLFSKDYLRDKGHVKQANAKFENVLSGKLDFLKMVIGSDNKRYKQLLARYNTLCDITWPPQSVHQQDNTVSKQFIKGPRQAYIRNEKDILPHKPQDTINFLKKFDNSKGIKYLTHDANTLDFTRESLLKTVKEEFETAEKQYVIPKTLLSLFNQFVFFENPKWLTWETGKEEWIYLGWSCKEIVDWCNEEVNKNKHPMTSFEFAKKMIEPFKNVIQVRRDYLPTLFKKLLNNESYKNFNINYDKSLKKASFYTHVNIFEAALYQLFIPFTEYAKLNNNAYNIKIDFKSKSIDDNWMRVIRITHIGSKPWCNSDDPSLVKGNLNLAKEHFNGLCNWSIEAEFEDGFKRRNILNDDNNIPIIENLNEDEKVLGFTHILSFYD